MGITGCCGSQWWILPDTIVKHALGMMKNKPFCSAIMASPYKDLLVQRLFKQKMVFCV